MKSTEEIIKFIATSKKKTPVKVYVNFNADVEFPETLEVYVKETQELSLRILLIGWNFTKLIKLW